MEQDRVWFTFLVSVNSGDLEKNHHTQTNKQESPVPVIISEWHAVNQQDNYGWFS